MKFIDRLPVNPEVGLCEKHGEYSFKYTEAWGGKYIVNEFCSRCASEAKEESEKEERERIKKEHKDRIELNRLSAGVSRRNVNACFDDINCDSEQKSNFKERILKWLVEFNNNKTKAPSIILSGKVGTGKTLIASCIINSINKEPYAKTNTKLIKLVDMVRSLKETWRRDSDLTERDLISKYSNLDLLIIDEVGMGFESETEKLFVFDVIDGRYQNELPTILISNLNVEGVKQSIGERAIDRLRDGGGFAIGCDWGSYRK